MRRLLARPATSIAATVLFAFACSTGDPPTGDPGSGATGGTGGARAGTGGTNAGTGGASVAGMPGSGGVGGGATGGLGSGGTTGGAGGATGSGGLVSAGGSAAGSPPGAGQGGDAGSGAPGGSAGSGAAGSSAMGGSAGDAVATGGMAGTAGSAGSSSAYPGTVIIEDDFDAGSALDPKWFAYPDFDANQQPKIDTTRTHSAPNAVRVTSSSSGSFLMNQMAAGLPVAGNKFYARVWVSFEKATTAVGGHAAFLVGAVAKDNAGTELRLGMSSPGSSVMLDLNLINATDGGGGEVTRFSNGYTTGGNPGDFPGMGFGFAANEWYCVEALFDGAGSEFRVWVADAELPDMHVQDFSDKAPPRTMWGPTFNYLKIGGQNYSGTIGQVWYDDIFVGTEPVGCAR